MAVGRIHGVAGVTGFSYEEMYERLPEQKRPF